MTMFVSGSHHFQVMCSGPRLKESTTTSPAQASVKEANLSSSRETPVKDSSHRALESRTTMLAFVYGTLKRGFGNYWLIEEQIKNKHCRLVGTATTKHEYPLVCGPFQVPFLLNVLGSGQHVHGELYQVDVHCLSLLDDLEGTTKGHYVRCPVTLTGIELDPSFKLSVQNGVSALNKVGDIQAEAYFAAPHITPGLYRAPHIEAYTEKESATYTRRIHRPQHRTFIEHVYHWIDEQQKISS